MESLHRSPAEEVKSQFVVSQTVRRSPSVSIRRHWSELPALQIDPQIAIKKNAKKVARANILLEAMERETKNIQKETFKIGKLHPHYDKGNGK
jgi:hypothetical protein